MAHKATALLGAVLLAAAGASAQSGKLQVDLDSPGKLRSPQARVCATATAAGTNRTTGTNR
jgi:hypothetical protein